MFSATSKTSLIQTITVGTSYTVLTFPKKVVFQFWNISSPNPSLLVIFAVSTSGSGVGVFEEITSMGQSVTIDAGRPISIRGIFASVTLKYIAFEV